MPQRPPPEKPLWESIVNAVSIALIPLVIAGVGWWMQKSSQNDSIRRDYVQLSVSILKSGDTAKANFGLRAWAVELLNANSPVKLNEDVQEQLKSGNISLTNSSDSSVTDPRTKISLRGLQPTVKYLALRLIELSKIEGLDIVINKGYISQSSQDSLYAFGRTKLGKIITYEKLNVHSKGLAFDFFMIKNGREVADKKSFDIVSSIGKNLGLKWGGDFNADYKNNYHFELRRTTGY